VPLRSMSDAGLGGGSPFPWLDKNAVIELEVAILQAYGSVNRDNQFQVVYVCQRLSDRYFEDGNPLPNQFQISIDAKGLDNPRRKVLDYFADGDADPLGPMMLVKADADNQAGWAWAWRECPLPADMVPVVDQIERSHYRQNWRQMELAAHEQRQAIASRAGASYPNGRGNPAQDAVPF